MIDLIWEIPYLDGLGASSQEAARNFIQRVPPCHVIIMQEALLVELKQQIKATEITQRDQACLRDT